MEQGPDRDGELQKMVYHCAFHRPRKEIKGLANLTINQVEIKFQGREEPGYRLSPEELCSSLLPPSLADASRVLWQNPAAICPFKTHLTARKRDPCGNKRGCDLGGARASSFGTDV